jgi:uncharacterized protein
MHKIIDSHVHLSMFGHEGLSFVQIRDSLISNMEKHGIRFSYIMPDSEVGNGVSVLDETLLIVKDHPQLKVLGTAHIPSLNNQLVSKLDALAAAGNVIGIKLYPGFELFYPDDIKCHALYKICLNHDIPVLFHSGETMDEAYREDYNSPKEIKKVATRFPGLKMIVAHFSQPHLEECKKLILEIPDVYADISGLAHPSVEKACGKKEIISILEAIAKQQPGKILYATDWPICDTEKHIKLVESLDIPDSSKAMIFSGNSIRLFKVSGII